MSTVEKQPGTVEKQAPKPGSIWITNNRDGAIILAHKPVFNPASKTTSLSKTHALMPGAQVVPRDFWEQWKAEDPDESQRLLRTKIPSDPHRTRRSERAGMTHLIEGPLVSDPKNPLAELSPEDAIAIAAEIIDERLLAQCLRIERRPPVAVALRAALDRFAKAAAEGGRMSAGF